LRDQKAGTEERSSRETQGRRSGSGHRFVHSSCVGCVGSGVAVVTRFRLDNSPALGQPVHFGNANFQERNLHTSGYRG